ncbi:MAG: indole-3-glycerol-phosphate synthase [Candidatus Atribacteria bacterium]|nr:indole-3-glycerol-phosphate synthase [Candidatus Atribacteria bacterium]
MNVLEQIIFDKKQNLKRVEPYNFKDIESLFAVAKCRSNQWIDLFKQKNEPVIIAEIKLASPSRGPILNPKNVPFYLSEYQRGGASALSVVTEEKFFKGSTPLLKKVIQNTYLPVLRKDFVINDIQIYQSAYFGVGALLIITKILSLPKIRNFISLCEQLNIIPLVEIHDQQDLEKALEARAQFIGINNRNLATLEVSLHTTEFLFNKIPDQVTVVCESGIKSREDLQWFMDMGINHFLIGEYLLFHSQPGEALRELKGIKKYASSKNMWNNPS